MLYWLHVPAERSRLLHKLGTNGIVLLALLHLLQWDVTYLGVNFASFDASQTRFLSGIGWWFMTMATVVTVWSGVDYTKSVIDQVGIE